MQRDVSDHLLALRGLGLGGGMRVPCARWRNFGSFMAGVGVGVVVAVLYLCGRNQALRRDAEDISEAPQFGKDSSQGRLPCVSLSE